MFSILRMGSRQYHVSLGSRIRVEKIDAKKGETWSSKEVLAFQDEKGAFTLGTPLVSKAEVRARVVRHGKEKKVLILKKKRRKGYRRTQGHRQNFTELYIEALANPEGKWKEVEKKVSKKTDSATKVTAKKVTTKKEATKKMKSQKVGAKKVTSPQTKTAPKKPVAKKPAKAKKD